MTTLQDGFTPRRDGITARHDGVAASHDGFTPLPGLCSTSASLLQVEMIG
jgi:hypothetical protein